MTATEATVARVARTSHARLLALLAARTRDVAAAEDALSEAFASALTHWPTRGVPDNPEAWLLTAARRQLIDAARHHAVHTAALPGLLVLCDELLEQDQGAPFPDERLRLLFACAHPALEPGVRTALMLQCVLGLDVARIAGAFLTTPATLAQRLVRAKRKMRAAGIPFEVPDEDELAPRLDGVLEAIYGAYGTGWDTADGADARSGGLLAEALELAEAVVALLPRAAEPRGLLALLWFLEARGPARRNPAGGYVPLARQDTQRWDRALMTRADALLIATANPATVGPFQLEAAIQSAHCHARLGADVPPAAVLALYDALCALRPRLGVMLGRIAALAAVAGPAQALAALDALPPDLVLSHQPYWALRAHVLRLLRDRGGARAAYARAATLATDPAVRAFLRAEAAHTAHEQA